MSTNFAVDSQLATIGVIWKIQVIQVFGALH